MTDFEQPLQGLKKNGNMRDSVLNSLLTTNNHIEGFHNKFSTLENFFKLNSIMDLTCVLGKVIHKTAK